MNTHATLIAKTVAQLTAPGAPFECVDVVVHGQPLRAYRHAFPTLQAMVQAARAHGPKPFIVSDGKTWTFDELFAQVDALAASWQAECALAPGDRVAIAMRNRAEWAVALVACLVCGAVPAPMNSFGLRDELCAQLADLKPRIWVCDEDRKARVQGAPELRGVETLVVGSREWERVVATGVSGAPALRPVQVQPDDAALILHTSGASSRA